MQPLHKIDTNFDITLGHKIVKGKMLKNMN